MLKMTMIIDKFHVFNVFDNFVEHYNHPTEDYTWYRQYIHRRT